MKLPSTSRLLLAAALCFSVLQLVRPSIPSKPSSSDLQAPPEVKRVLVKGCYACHSDEGRLCWFDQIVPAYWLVRHDILEARAHLNFSTLGSKPPTAQKARLFEAVNMIQLGAMPLPAYSRLHPEARLTTEDVVILKSYLNPWANDRELPISHESAGVPPPRFENAVANEFSGLAFDHSSSGWKLISVTDRGDNNTLRLVLGNDTAIQAAQSGRVSPWPDGTQFAKIAWKKTRGADGLIHPGDFVQTEFMLKDSAHFKRTDGWNWGRWLGPELKPYGSDRNFVGECTGCHQPVKGNDYVYTLPITKATVSGSEMVNNQAAMFPAGSPFQPLMWQVITMYVDDSERTVSVLFGNEKAIAAINECAATGGLPLKYAPGSVLALITWRQREDPHWFGARIPGDLQTMETVELGPPTGQYRYRRYAGAKLLEQLSQSSTQNERTQSILKLAPVLLP
jgi:hypothetical protein